MKALVPINLAAREYQDVAFARIGRDPATTTAPNGANWLDWLNDAQRAVVLVRPDANAVTQNLTLIAGTRQTLPAGGLKLLGVSRNMGADGTTVGRALRFAVHEEQDAVNLDWHSEAQASPVREVIYDDRKDPLTFWTRPPAVAGWKIEAIMSKAPTDVTDAAAGDITISEVYAPAMQSWMLYCAYAMATQAAGNFARAQFFFQSFFNLLGVKLKGDIFAGPYARAQMPVQG